MYGCYDAAIVYGFAQGDRSYVLNEDYMEEHFGFDPPFALDVVREHGGEAVYGIQVYLKSDGTLNIKDEDKERVHNAYAALSKFRKFPPIKYHTAVYGDFQICWERYTPETKIPPWDQEKIQNDQDEEEEEEETASTSDESQAETAESKRTKVDSENA